MCAKFHKEFQTRREPYCTILHYCLQIELIYDAMIG